MTEMSRLKRAEKSKIAQQAREWRERDLMTAQTVRELVDRGSLPLNRAPGFWDIYRQRPGMLRRRALVALFQRYPLAKLPVNNHWQANLIDPDLRCLLKSGVLVQVRDGGCYRTPGNKSSRKRQTYLALAFTVK